jgi:hypothetical protein
VGLAREPSDVTHDPDQLRRQDGADPEDLSVRAVPYASTSSRMCVRPAKRPSGRGRAPHALARRPDASAFVPRHAGDEPDAKAWWQHLPKDP